MASSRWSRIGPVLRRDPYASAMRPIAVLALVLGACTFTEALPVETVVHDSAEVVAVVDGDTLLVAVDGREESVRLIGVNAPERGECLFEEATAALADAVARRFSTLLSTAFHLLNSVHICACESSRAQVLTRW